MLIEVGSARYIDLTVRECFKKKKRSPIFLSPEYTRRHTPPHNESEWTHKHSQAPRYSVCAKFRLRPRYERDLFPVCVCVSAKRPPNLSPSVLVCVCVCVRGDAMESSLSPVICCVRGAVMSCRGRSGQVSPLHKKKKNSGV